MWSSIREYLDMLKKMLTKDEIESIFQLAIGYGGVFNFYQRYMITGGKLNRRFLRGIAGKNGLV